MNATRLALALLLSVMALPASAAEYRLQVASLYENSFASFLKPGEFSDGAAGPGLDRLEASLDRGDVPKAALLYDRHLQTPPDGTVRAWGGVPVKAALQQGGYGQVLWDEARWEGTPGELAVWVITPTSRRPQELRWLALKGVGPLRQFQPYNTPPKAGRLPAVRFPLSFLQDREQAGALWQPHVSPVLDLSAGIGLVVGADPNPQFADHVYLIVSQAAEPTTYKAVLAWRQRPEDFETPGGLRRTIPR